MAIFPIQRLRESVSLHATVNQLPMPYWTGGDPLYQAVVTDGLGVILWTSVSVPTRSLAEYLGWYHMALLATRLQETWATTNTGN